MILFLFACTPGPAPAPVAPPPPPPAEPAPAPVVEVPAAPETPAAFVPFPPRPGIAQWAQDLAVTPLSVDEFSARAPAAVPLDHDPSTAAYLDSIVTKLGLTPAEKARIAQAGLVMTRPTPQRSLPGRNDGLGSYAEVYRAIYGRDLPVLITLDSVWFAFDQAYADTWLDVQTGTLREHLDAALALTRKHLSDAPAATRADLDVLLSVAVALGEVPEEGRKTKAKAMDPANQQEVARVYALAVAADDTTSELYGRQRALPLSRLVPQGLYEQDADAKAWWRLAAWLQVSRFVLVEDGAPNPRETADALALSDLVASTGAAKDLAVIDGLIGALVGPPEGIAPADVLAWRAEQADAAKPTDPPDVLETAALALQDRFTGRNQVRSTPSLEGLPADAPRPAPLTWSFLPARFTLDAHVFTEVTFDRVGADGQPVARTHPSPLDVAYVLGNDAAVPLIAPELETSPYQATLAALRAAADATPADWWTADIHHRWLDVIRSTNIADSRLPPAFAGDAGRRRLLQTQLVAWTRLKREHALFAEEPAEEGGCSFPAIYVDPYPTAWRRLADLSEAAKAAFGHVGARNLDVFDAIAKESRGLGDAAEQLLATGHLDDATGAHLSDFIVTGAVYSDHDEYSGWYPALFRDDTYLEEPTGHARAFRGVDHSLWVRAGDLAFVVVTVNTGHGPSAFVGPIQGFDTALVAGSPNDAWERPAWLADLQAETGTDYSVPPGDKFPVKPE